MMATKIRTALPLLALMAAAGLWLTALALGASVHFKDGQNFTDNGLTLTVSGQLAGLGFGDVLVSISVLAAPTATCTTPSGANQAPGQNPAFVTVTGTAAIPNEQIKNGNTPYSVITLPPVTPIPNAPDCPNPNWTESITDMAFISPVTITVSQGGVTVLGPVDCTFSPSPTSGNSGTLNCPKK